MNERQHHKHIEDMQHLGVDTEGPKLPEEVQSVLSCLVDSLRIVITV